MPVKNMLRNQENPFSLGMNLTKVVKQDFSHSGIKSTIK